jgi:serine/threonine protein kinase
MMETGKNMIKYLPMNETDRVKPTKDWKPIINPDIKPMNVMLGEAQDNYYPAYKIPKMIDFGICFDDNRLDTALSKLDGFGTPGWHAPVCPTIP